MKERRTTRKLPSEHCNTVISSLYEQIQNRKIWIPYGEVKKYAFSKSTKKVKSLMNQFPKFSEKIEA